MVGGLQLAVRAWSAWAPQRETPAAWRAWARATDLGISEASTGSIVVPMMLRRPTTALGQKMLASALACGETALDTFGCGFIEAAADLVEQPSEPVLLVFGDEPLPGEYNVFGGDDVDLPLVVALALQVPAAGDDGILFEALPRSAAVRPSTAAPIDFLRFLLSGAQSAVSEGARMTWTWRRAA